MNATGALALLQVNVTVSAVSVPGTRVTIRGACSATYVPVGENLPSSASCSVFMGGPQSVEVAFG